MVSPENIGARVCVRAADDFYAFINGKEGVIDRFESGHAVIRTPSTEFEGVELQFLIPPDQLEILV